MAATAMDPVDIANILAQELLYQQVTIERIVPSVALFLEKCLSEIREASRNTH